MKKYLNQRGYALLIVIITIILFLSLASVVFTATLNTAKQENTVNNKNQSVVAAEMGVKSISVEFKNSIKKTQNAIKSDMINLKSCSETNTCTCENLDSVQLNKNEFINRLNQCYVKEIEELIKKVNIDYSQKETITSAASGDTSFRLKQSISLPVVVQPNEDYYLINFGVVGNSMSEKTSELKADIKISKFTENLISEKIESIATANDQLDNSKIFATPPTQQCSLLTLSQVNSTVGWLECKVSPGEKVDSLVAGLLAKGINLAKLNLYIEDYSSFCGSSCNNTSLDINNNLTFYVNGLDLGNNNNSQPFTLISNGNFVLDNANSFGDLSKTTYILAKGFSGGNIGLVNTRMVLTGGSSTNQFTHKSFSMDNLSRACMNIDYYTPASITNLYTIEGTGKVIIFKSNNSSVLFNKNNMKVPANVTVTSDPNDFAQKCELQKLGVDSFYSISSELTDALVDNVNYNP